MFEQKGGKTSTKRAARLCQIKETNVTKGGVKKGGQIELTRLLGLSVSRLKDLGFIFILLFNLLTELTQL